MARRRHDLHVPCNRSSRHKPNGFGLTHIHMHDGVEVFWQVLL